jgi:uncharacterized C2H2 Zn-finger protein
LNKIPFDRYYKCPKCHSNFRQEWNDSDGSAVVGSRVIGVEIRGLYDGVAYWECPDCRVVWHRWADSPGNRDLRNKIERFWAEHGKVVCHDTD